MYKLFSVDDHIMEPPHLWTSRVGARFRDRVPHVETDPATGKETWRWDGGEHVSTCLYAVAGKPQEEWNFDAITFADMIPGCYDPEARAKDFLSNGIAASVSFPTLIGFAGQMFRLFKDKELASVCVEAYNDFIVDEWCAGGPKGMFVPTMIGKVWDPEATAAEIRRCARRGVRAINWMENPVGLDLPSYWTDHWDPVWQAIEETEMAVTMHIGSGSYLPVPSPEAPDTLYISLSYVCAMSAAANLAMSPTCRKFKNLKLVFSEGGIGWLPAALERMDFQWRKHGYWTKLTGAPPSEIIRRNMYFCMIQEPWGFRTKEVRDVIGDDHIFWETDYPHADTPWPNTQAAASEMFEGLPTDVIEKAAYRNAERVFNWRCAELPREVRQAA
jgi:predicted TIM-barrel fold metal-dependent hydrolase